MGKKSVSSSPSASLRAVRFSDPKDCPEVVYDPDDSTSPANISTEPSLRSPSSTVDTTSTGKLKKVVSINPSKTELKNFADDNFVVREDVSMSPTENTIKMTEDGTVDGGVIKSDAERRSAEDEGEAEVIFASSKKSIRRPETFIKKK